MTNSTCQLLLLAFMVLCAASQLNLVVVGSPTPSIKSQDSTQNSPNSAAQQNQNSKPPKDASDAIVDVQMPAANPKTQIDDNSAIQMQSIMLTQLQQKISVADKLKRGLTNFINHYNPAPYFVPNSSQLTSQQPVLSNGIKQAATKSASSTRDTPTIVNDAPNADAVIKGPNRLVQARPLGGPLRWGRR